MPLSKAIIHENTAQHTQRHRTLDQTQADPFTSPMIGEVPLASSPPSPILHPAADTIDRTVDTLHGQDFHPEDIGSITGPALPDDDPDDIYDDWGGQYGDEMHASEDCPPEEPEDEDEDIYVARVWGPLEDPLEWEEQQFSFNPDGIEPDDNVRLADVDSWWPWRNEEECLMDVMTAFPRSLFSESEMEVTRWFARRLGASDVPSVQQVKNHRHEVLAVAGASPKLLEGNLGHVYSMLDLATILRHEFANPEVRPHIRTFAEEAHGFLEQTYHASRWLTEVNSNFAAPMVRAADGQDYFVHEPALARTRPGQVNPVLPTRWYLRDGKHWAKAHPLITSHDGTTFDIIGSICLEIPLTDFQVSMQRLEHSYTYHELPPPHRLKGEERSIMAHLD
ncbi:hypothetical protein HWV62_9415 [Athelia sp. TMB]|nr:hypothetical protein HWV62_9415 [Athelia sp. TMB]